MQNEGGEDDEEKDKSEGEQPQPAVDLEEIKVEEVKQEDPAPAGVAIELQEQPKAAHEPEIIQIDPNRYNSEPQVQAPAQDRE